MLEALGCRVVGTDELTGIRALERAAPTKPTRPGCPERREREYIRHGTTTLIATRNVATGGILAPALGPTRTEVDFAAHIARVIDTDPDAAWLFVADNLNTHQSAALVRLVARCGLAADLGTKGRDGDLRSQASRAAFLAHPAHRISFLHTPKHTPWLNQIERWFQHPRPPRAQARRLRLPRRPARAHPRLHRPRQPDRPALPVDLQGPTALPLTRYPLPRPCTSDQPGPRPVPGLTGIVAVRAGLLHSLALGADGKVWAWGWDDFGQLGNGTVMNPEFVPTPGRVPGLTEVVAVDAGLGHSLALRADGSVWARGNGSAEEVGDGTASGPHFVPIAGPVPALTEVVTIDAGAHHSLALTATGGVWAWGWNQDGQLGDGTIADPEDVPTPRRVPGLTGVVAIDAGWFHTLAIAGAPTGLPPTGGGAAARATSSATLRPLLPLASLAPGAAVFRARRGPIRKVRRP
jgi:hypothetical protein